MQTTPSRRNSASRARFPRHAFTLVEVLVVITIISVLAALITVASVRFIGQARAAATRTTIKKVDEAIHERVAAVNRWHQRPIRLLRHDWEIRGWPQRWIAHCLEPVAGTGAQNEGSDEAKMVLSRKGMLLELLPVSQEELKQAYWFWARFDEDGIFHADGSVDFIVIRNVKVPYLSSAEIDAMNAWLADIDEDSSNNTPSGGPPGRPSDLNLPGEIFYYALLNAPVFGGQRISEDDFGPSELVDTDGDGVPELADGWGNPLRFYRWPTRLVNNGEPLSANWSNNVARQALMPSAPAEAPTSPSLSGLKQDPDDRAGYLSLRNQCYGIPIVAFFHDLNTWHTPLIVSAGPDGQLGLREPDYFDPADPLKRVGLAEPTSEEELFDNITNLNASGDL